MNLQKFLTDVGPTECSRANNRRPQDGTRYLRTLTSRAAEIERVAEHSGKAIIIVRDDLKRLLISTINSAGDTITEQESLDLLFSLINDNL